MQKIKKKKQKPGVAICRKKRMLTGHMRLSA